MKKIGKLIENLTPFELKGLAQGVIGATIGALIFSAAIATWLSLSFDGILFLSLFIFFLKLSLLFTFIPSGIVGVYIARQIEQDFKRGVHSKWKQVLRGCLMVTLLVIISVGIFCLLSDQKFTLIVYIGFIIAASFIANLICGGVSLYLSGQVEKIDVN